ncbi:MAG: SDR family oxidoreductase [Ruminococcaceae bacterium]|nr:SDR family oxidoreductase [Oscillospiraceae bacterium]
MASAIESLVEYSNRYGSDPGMVLAGGGNTSMKTDQTIYVKGSGTSLATITEAGFVVMSRRKLAEIWRKKYSKKQAEREAEVLEDMMAARLPGEEAKRPSVETLLHDLFPQKFVLHVHPSRVNALTCSAEGAEGVKRLFPDAVWVDECEPGYILASKCREKLAAHKAETGSDANVVFLQNHGVFFAAKTVNGLDEIVSEVMTALDGEIKTVPDFTPVETDRTEAARIAPVLRMLYDEDGQAAVTFTANRTILDFAASEESFAVLKEPLSPDHIVYCKAEPLYLETSDPEAVAAAFRELEERRGFKPKVAFAKGIGMFTVGKTLKEAKTAAAVWQDAMSITVMAENFGGVRHMAPAMVDFIVNWEVESYRAKVSLAAADGKKLTGKIAVVTGSAQGFGEGIARFLASEGASVVIADMNAEGAKNTAESIANDLGANTLAVSANVSDEDSVREMIENTVLTFGGLDIFVNNAGIVRAGSEEMTKKNLELVTAVNYTAYFLCAKYASAVMKLQRIAAPEYMADIIEINSKSGLAGSNKNFAYAGSKFGGIGLTQSFALELAPFGIKVNAVCPGNFLDGPLWSDPEKGLFVQYLNAGKVPGAKTVDDVRKFYEAKVPLGRGCRIEDVAKAVAYIIDQKYETGQAVPVTGGQEMLK